MKRFAARRSFLCARWGAVILLAVGVAAWTPALRADDDSSLGGSILSFFGFGSTKVTARPAPEASDPSSTHEFKKAVTVRGSDGINGVQTFCLDREGRIVALVSQPRYSNGSARRGDCEVHLLTAEGEPIRHWKVDFIPQSINTGPDGTIFVAGDGTIARFTPEGKLQKQLELPHIKEHLKDKDALRKRAEEENRQQRRSYASIRASFRQRIERLEAVAADKRTRPQNVQLEQYRRSLKAFDGDSETPDIDAVVKSIVSRVRIINSVAVSAKDVFIVCGETTGYGYALWRLDPDFGSAKPIKSGMRGCCGQMDVQVDGSDLLVAENCEHAFARYDRDGKLIGRWGKQGNSGEGRCFGGCCNPMNVRCGPKGDVFTAESEGLIKRFDSKGEFVSLVGKRTLSGGCKNVAVAASPDGKLVYFCDQPGSQIVILAEKPKSVAQAKTIAD